MLAGCAAPDVRWHADKRFTTEERNAIESGAAWLEGASGHEVGAIAFDYEVTSDQPLAHTIRRERGSNGTERGATGMCAGGTVYIDPVGLPDEGMRAEYLPGLAAHEMGHCAVGLADDASTEGIMRVLYPMRWTAREANQVASPK